MPVTEDHVLLGSEPLEPHRTPGVDLVSGDTDFSPQTILKAVREALDALTITELESTSVMNRRARV